MPSDASPLGVAVVGTGTMGRRRIASLQEMQGATLRCVFDEDPLRARQVGESARVDVARDLGEILRRDDVGLVIVCVPNVDHEGIVGAALSSGRHVICEKPLGMDATAARRMADAADAAGRFLKVGANHRYIPSVQSAVDLVRRGELGRPLVFRGWIGHDGSRFGSPWFTQRTSAGGGTFLDNGVHLLDIGRWMMGESSGCIARVANLAHPDWDVEDYATATFDTVAGGIISVTSSWIDRSGYFYFEVHGEKGFVSVDADRGMVVGPPGLGIPPAPDPGPPGASYNRELTEAIESIHAGRPPSPTGRDGAAVLRMVDAAYESSRTDRMVEI
jgi:UDP-N-acetylglucosamine 3-dehydrogenase